MLIEWNIISFRRRVWAEWRKKRILAVVSIYGTTPPDAKLIVGSYQRSKFGPPACRYPPHTQDFILEIISAGSYPRISASCG